MWSFATVVYVFYTKQTITGWFLTYIICLCFNLMYSFLIIVAYNFHFTHTEHSKLNCIEPKRERNKL